VLLAYRMVIYQYWVLYSSILLLLTKSNELYKSPQQNYWRD